MGIEGRQSFTKSPRCSFFASLYFLKPVGSWGVPQPPALGTKDQVWPGPTGACQHWPDGRVCPVKAVELCYRALVDSRAAGRPQPSPGSLTAG